MQLATSRLVLREFVEDDWRWVHAVETPDVVRYMTQDPATPESARAYIERVQRLAAEDPRRIFDFAVVRAAEPERVIGRSGMGLEAHHNAQVWFLLDPQHRAQGYATEATRAVIDFAFDRLGVHRVYGDCDPRNTASAQLMERLGMRREAHHVENWFLKGEWCDSWIYAVLDREWAARPTS